MSLQYYTPRLYQMKGEDHLATHKQAGLWFDMGLGKTSTTLAAFKRLKQEGKVDVMLVVGPLKVIQTAWPGELNKWIEFSDLTYTILQGPDRHQRLLDDVDVYLINYENIPWLLQQPTWIAGDRRKILVFDELSKMKSWDSQRVKAFRQHGKKGFPFLLLFEYRWGLTGTPKPNTYEDLFSQTYMLDMGARFGEGITRYRDKYFETVREKNPQTGKVQPVRRIKKGAEVEIATKVADLYLRMDGADWLELPEEIHNYIALDLPEALVADYKTLETEFFLELSEEDHITALSSSSLSMKLRQFLSGMVYREDRSVARIHDLKYQALDDLVDGLAGEPLLLAYMFQHELEELKRRYPHATVLDSHATTERANRIVADFNAGLIPILIGHPMSIGHGLNLQEACHNVAFFSLDFNLENFQQFIKRVSRSGQRQESVFVHYLIFKDTIESSIVKALERKGEEQDWLLDYVKNHSLQQMESYLW